MGLAGGPEPVGPAWLAAPESKAKRLTTTDSKSGAEAAPAARAGKKRLLLAIPVVLALLGLGIWQSGLLRRHTGGHSAAKAETAEAARPVYAEMPDIIANLNSPYRQPTFVKLKVKLELAKAADAAAVSRAMPQLMDMVTTYVRDLRPDELRGSAGTYRLREALLARANILLAPAQVLDVLFVQMIVQ